MPPVCHAMSSKFAFSWGLGLAARQLKLLCEAIAGIIVDTALLALGIFLTVTACIGII